jgi:gas vesicle protein
MTSGKIVLGALAGAAAGTLIGILFAPDKGSDTRQKIAHKGEEYVHNLKGKVTEIMNNGEHQRSERVKESAA